MSPLSVFFSGEEHLHIFWQKGNAVFVKFVSCYYIFLEKDNDLVSV